MKQFASITALFLVVGQSAGSTQWPTYYPTNNFLNATDDDDGAVNDDAVTITSDATSNVPTPSETSGTQIPTAVGTTSSTTASMLPTAGEEIISSTTVPTAADEVIRTTVPTAAGGDNSISDTPTIISTDGGTSANNETDSNTAAPTPFQGSTSKTPTVAVGSPSSAYTTTTPTVSTTSPHGAGGSVTSSTPTVMEVNGTTTYAPTVVSTAVDPLMAAAASSEMNGAISTRDFGSSMVMGVASMMVGVGMTVLF